jgi:hypothetical protein
MLFLLWIWDFAGQTAKFVLRLIDLALDPGALEGIEGDRGADQTPVIPANDRLDHPQIA